METEDSVLSVNANRRRRWSGQFKPPELIDFSESLENNDEIEEDDSNDSNEAAVRPRRSLRKKINMSLPEIPKELNKPKKLSEKSSLKDIKNYYLNKSVKILNPSLETIFEEPQQVKNEEVMMSSRKYRRSIIFKPTTVKNPMKIKKRKLKAKQVLGNKRPNKVSLTFLKDKLAEISDE